MRHPLALALLLISAAASFSRADPLSESAPDLACPDCNQINAAVRVKDGIVAVGAYGLIAHKSSAGRWQQLPVPVRRMLTSVVATREGHLVATGHDALILSSPGPGKNWAIVHADPAQDAPLLDLWIGSDGRGFAIGAYGLALLTQDHGLSWTPHEIDSQENHFYAIDEAPNGSLFICGEFGTVLRSHNRGEDWVQLGARARARRRATEPVGTARFLAAGAQTRTGSCCMDLKAPFWKAWAKEVPGSAWKPAPRHPSILPPSCRMDARSSPGQTGRYCSRPCPESLNASPTRIVSRS